MKCPHCGQTIPDTAVHCAYCGAPVIEGVSQSGQQSVAAAVLIPTTRGKRFVNMFFDGIGLVIMQTVIGILLTFVLPSGILYSISWLVIPFAYFFLTELTWEKTPAKFLTHTRVVTSQGGQPTAANVAIRTLTRYIPFEALSFLFSRRPVGWHDTFSQTMVVDDTK